jgi:hypothetical protein
VGDYTWIELPNGERTFTLSPEDYDGTILAEGIDVQTDPLTELVDGEWVCPISVLKERKWEAVKAIRAEKLLLSSTPFGVAQSDLESMVKINGLVSMAEIAKSTEEPFSEIFTMADNSEVELDADDMIAFGVAVGRHIAATHGRARSLRNVIDSATTPEELDAIDIDSAWPA